MNPWRWVDPRVREVRLQQVSAYLLAHGWKLGTTPNSRSLLFEKKLPGVKAPMTQYLPASEDYSDFARLMTEFITSFSEFEDRHPVDLLNDVLRSEPGAAALEPATVAPQRTNGTPRKKRTKRPA